MKGSCMILEQEGVVEFALMIKVYLFTAFLKHMDVEIIN